MAVTIYHKLYSFILQQFLHTPCPSTGITADMGEKGLHFLYLKDLQLRTFALYHPMIDVSAHCPHHRHHLLKPLYNSIITDITCVPHFVAILEMSGIAIIPIAMCIA